MCNTTNRIQNEALQQGDNSNGESIRVKKKAYRARGSRGGGSRRRRQQQKADSNMPNSDNSYREKYEEELKSQPSTKDKRTMFMKKDKERRELSNGSGRVCNV